ncbi:uncharacterized protein [Dermacentor albipictus]|uniref:uncharacterized protein n=1 Tax=Dermacentor albipictus TaxID=60249 RepID=UPI0031FBA772
MANIADDVVNEPGPTLANKRAGQAKPSASNVQRGPVPGSTKPRAASPMAADLNAGGTGKLPRAARRESAVPRNNAPVAPAPGPHQAELGQCPATNKAQEPGVPPGQDVVEPRKRPGPSESSSRRVDKKKRGRRRTVPPALKQQDRVWCLCVILVMLLAVMFMLILVNVTLHQTRQARSTAPATRAEDGEDYDLPMFYRKVAFPFVTSTDADESTTLPVTTELGPTEPFFNSSFSM